MPGYTRSLQDLIDAVSDRADIQPAAAGVRHTTAKVVARINRAIRRWRFLVADAGDDSDMVTKRVQTNPSSTRDANNWAPNQYLTQPQPSDGPLAFVRGMDIWATSTRPIAMMPADDMERDDGFRSWWNNGGTGMPVFYRMGGHTTAAPLIQIFPWADKAYDVDVRYIPTWMDETSPVALIEFNLGGDEYVINDAAVQSLIVDGQGAGAAAQSCRGWNTDLEKTARFQLAKRSPVNKIDTRERRRELMAWSNPAWRGS